MVTVNCRVTMTAIFDISKWRICSTLHPLFFSGYSSSRGERSVPGGEVLRGVPPVPCHCEYFSPLENDI